MEKKILVALASVIALAGCESLYRTFGAGSPPPPDARNPNVWVVTKPGTCQGPYIVVDQEPIYIYRPGNAQTVPIKWTLQTDGYLFVDEPKITDPTPIGNSAPGEIYNCHAAQKNMDCTNRAQNTGTWKYTLNVKSDKAGCPSPPKLDPQVSND